MGAKSRGNYPIPFCTKFACANRDKKCEHCVKVRGEMCNYEERDAQESND